jgi:hypothetical protein
MSSAPAASATRRTTERRSHQRYPISLKVDYRLLRRGHVDGIGSARTIDMASGGVLLDTKATLTPGTSIELFINWPMLLEGVCPLRLVMWGRITRSDSRGVAIQTKQHEFRTAGIRTSKNGPPDSQVRSHRG